MNPFFLKIYAALLLLAPLLQYTKYYLFLSNSVNLDYISNTEICKELFICDNECYNDVRTSNKQKFGFYLFYEIILYAYVEAMLEEDIRLD